MKMLSMRREEEINEPDEIIEPAVGMEFDSIEDAFEFYKHYSFLKGFGVVKRSNHKDDDNVYVQYKFSCYKHTKPKEGRDWDEPPIGSRKGGILGTKCKANITIKDSNTVNLWVVATINLEHNHDLTLETAHKITTHRSIPLRFKKELEFNEDEGIRPCDNIDLVISHAGGIGKCTFTRKDARNHIDSYKKRKMKPIFGNDATLLMEYFDKKKIRDPNFFFSCKFEDDGRLKNIFWSDGRGRASYKYFHDVVVLDSTYLTNRYRLPLICLNGVSHHGHTTLLACALVSNEDDPTYCWFFSKVLECMDNVKPGAILTDQCKSMENGIPDILLGVVHRFCAWHITHKLSGRWGQKKNKEQLTSDVKSTVYGSLTPEEFEENWGKVMEAIGYQNDEWFQNLHIIREKWIPAYLDHRFWAGMTTTQRAESMNAYLNRFLKKNSTLGEFVVQMECAGRKMYDREVNANHVSKSIIPKLHGTLPLEQQMRDAYTNAIFYKCQEEVMRCFDLACDLESSEDDVKLYIVTDFSVPRDYKVKINTASQDVSCICQLFESMGIPCCHCIIVLKQEHIISLPERYIVDRWKKDFKRANLAMADLCFSHVPEGENRHSLLYRKVNSLMEDIMELGSENEESSATTINALNALRNKLCGNEEDPVAQIEGPSSSRGRGRGAGRGKGRGRGAGRGKANQIQASLIDNATSGMIRYGTHLQNEEEVGGGRGRGKGRGHGRGRGRGQNALVIAENVHENVVNPDRDVESNSSSPDQPFLIFPNEITNCMPAPGVVLKEPLTVNSRGRGKKGRYKHPVDVVIENLNKRSTC